MIHQVSIYSLHLVDELGIPPKEDEILAYSTYKFLIALTVQKTGNEI